MSDHEGIAGAAAFVNEIAPALAASLGAMAAAVRQADGQHRDFGAGTAEKRAAARRMVEAAEAAQGALLDLTGALESLELVFGGEDFGGPHSVGEASR